MLTNIIIKVVFVNKIKALCEKDDYMKKQKQEEATNQILYEITEKATEYYISRLQSTNDEDVLDCLREHGLKEYTINKFRIGYTGKDRIGLVSYLEHLGYTDAHIIEAGLADITENGDIEDTFQNRIMIPIMDDDSKVIGFCGRTVDCDKGPIYLVSRETPILNKNMSLFGLNFAKETDSNYEIICEGFMDVMLLYQDGYDNAVATVGTEFTSYNAEQIKKYCEKVVICYDTDEVGKNSAENVKEILEQAGIEAKQVDLSPYRDPMEFILRGKSSIFGEAYEKNKDCLHRI